jgi:hypothetical protein
MRTLFSLVAAIIAVNAFAGAPLQMVDRVRSISLSNDGKSYKVAFFRHAAYYHVGVRSSAVNCLMNSAKQKTPVSTVLDAKTLEISACKPAPSQTSPH